jgi:hypothetical protein
VLSSVVLCPVIYPLFGKLPKEVWGKGEAYTGFWWGNMRERDHLGDPGLKGKIILRWIFRNWDLGAMDYIYLAQVMDRWRALVDAVMKLRVP